MTATKRLGPTVRARAGSSWSPSTTKDKTARPSGPEARTGRARA